MNKEQQAILNMAKFIKNQTLLLLERINNLDLDDCAEQCEILHEHAEVLYTDLRKQLETN